MLNLLHSTGPSWISDIYRGCFPSIILTNIQLSHWPATCHHKFPVPVSTNQQIKLGFKQDYVLQGKPHNKLNVKYSLLSICSYEISILKQYLTASLWALAGLCWLTGNSADEGELASWHLPPFCLSWEEERFMGQPGRGRCCGAKVLGWPHIVVTWLCRLSECFSKAWGFTTCPHWLHTTRKKSSCAGHWPYMCISAEENTKFCEIHWRISLIGYWMLLSFNSHRLYLLCWGSWSQSSSSHICCYLQY